ncbi:hypothetical protein H1R20_g2033, partial [Candolleomyces eurysporus]
MDPGRGRGHPEPGAGPLRSDKETIVFLRRSLIEAEQKIDLWKEQADEARKENIQFKSNARVLQIELKSTQQELARAREEYQRQGEMVRELRTQIRAPKDAECRCNAKSLKTELETTQKQLVRMRDEYKKQARVLTELRAEKSSGHGSKSPHPVTPPASASSTHRNFAVDRNATSLVREHPSDSDSDSSSDYEDLDFEEVKMVDIQRPRSSATLPPPPRVPVVTSSKELNLEEEPARAVESARRGDQAKEMLNRDFALAKQLDRQLNSRGSSALPSNFQSGPIFLSQRLAQMESLALHYQKVYQQARAQHQRIYNQARALEMEYGSARKHIHVLEEELKGMRNELTVVKQQLSDAVNLAEIRGKEIRAIAMGKN